MTPPIFVFDAYGTLFDVDGAARQEARDGADPRFGELWPGLSAAWRRKQLEYTWLRAITGDHCDFAQVTADALDWAMEDAGLDDPALRDRLLGLYRELPAYPEVSSVLERLRGRGAKLAILSNGSPDMLDAACDAAGLGAVLDAVISVEAAGIFKPSAKVYDLVGARFGHAPGDVVFVSSNGWDVAGAAGYGFVAVWVNRRDAPVDRLPGRPAQVLSDLRGLADLHLPAA